MGGGLGGARLGGAGLGGCGDDDGGSGRRGDGGLGGGTSFGDVGAPTQGVESLTGPCWGCWGCWGSYIGMCMVRMFPPKSRGRDPPNLAGFNFSKHKKAPLARPSQFPRANSPEQF